MNKQTILELKQNYEEWCDFRKQIEHDVTSKLAKINVKNENYLSIIIIICCASSILLKYRIFTIQLEPNL